MGRIIELSHHVANQIAAGEVVERPLSVIKELLENALDAKAKNIEIRLKDGGLSYILVHDDGCGMDEEDLILATKRYATSKLSNAHDLCAISSFGFRGEALPSIASISNMSIISRMPESDYGAKVVIEGGNFIEKSRSRAAPGTRVEVRDLFFNVPARLKFVKTQRAETSAIDKLLRAYAYIQPDVSFKFFNDEKLVFSSPANMSNLARAQALLGHDTKGMLHEISAKTELINLQGALAAPMVTRRDGRGMVIFVNNRLVSDKKLVGAIKASFRTLLEVGRHPIGALSIEISPEEVDVNVHPRKTEVRFANERRVLSHIINLLGNFLSQTPWLTQTKKVDSLAFETLSAQSWPMSLSQENHMASYDFLLSAPRVFIQEHEQVLPRAQSLLPTEKFSELRVIGQVQTTYLLLQSHDGLVVIDQHAAHERISFERIRAARDVNLITKTFLIPMSFEVSRADLALALEYLQDFKKFGIDLEPFGETTLVVRAVPDFIEQENAQVLIQDILAELAEHGRADSLHQIHDQLCATIACHSSIRAGQRLGKEEIAALLLELDQIDFGAHCPHGRPVVKSFSSGEMKKWFHRT
jgi:DNA mismatch repair protein MutL